MATFEENIERAKTRGRQASSQLRLWPESHCGVPNSVLRGALFSVGHTRTLYKSKTVIASQKDCEIKFLGVGWNQIDLDVLQQLVVLAGAKGERAEFASGALLVALGRKQSGDEYRDLDECIGRLAGGLIEIHMVKEGKAIAGTLIKASYRDDVTGRYVVVFNDTFQSLYKDGYTLINCQERQALGKNQLAKWLYSFYSTHANPYDIKVETLWRLCGSKCKRLSDFRTALRVAMSKVIETGVISSYQIGQLTDLLVVERRRNKRVRSAAS